MGERATVIGSGIGGLAAACTLAGEGYDVTVIEKQETLGGVANTIERDGFQFDFGPSWYLMPEVFERFFAQFGRTPSDFYELERLDPRFTVFYKDGDSITVPDKTEQIRDIFGERELNGRLAFDQFMNESERAYTLGMDRFVWPNRQSVRDFVDMDVVRSASALGLFRESLGTHVGTYFDNEKLRQLLLYSIVFLGGTPQTTPALYKLMDHVVLEKGVYHPIGGMREVPEAFVSLGDTLGVEYYSGREVTAINGQRGSFTVETQHASFESDVVVSNASYQHTEQQLLSPSDRQYNAEYWENRSYGPSAFLLYAGVDGSVDPLTHHSLVFPDNWDDHFATIDEAGGLPENPAYYLSVPSKTDDSVAPDGKHTIVALVPISCDAELDEQTEDAYKQTIIQDLRENVGVDIAGRIETATTATPSTFSTTFNRPSRTALGLAHTRRQTSILRPSMRSSTVDGLYFVGGDTTPGIGVPMCVIGGMHAAELVSSDET